MKFIFPEDCYLSAARQHQLISSTGHPFLRDFSQVNCFHQTSFTAVSYQPHAFVMSCPSQSQDIIFRRNPESLKLPSYVILPARHNADLQYCVKVFEVIKRKHLLAWGNLRTFQFQVSRVNWYTHLIQPASLIYIHKFQCPVLY